MKRLAATVMATMLFASLCGAADETDAENPHVWKSKVSQVTVFKNGLGFFLRQGEVQLRDGWCVSEAVPPAAFGTLAIFPHDTDQLVDVIGSGPGEIVEFDGVDAPKDIAAKRARLEACKFLKLQVSYRQQGTERAAAGQLVSVGPEYAVLQADAQSFAVPIDGIAKLSVLEKPVRVHVASSRDKAPAKATLGMAYLRKGVTWIPEYTLKLLDDNTAELTLRGTFINEAEDLVHCDVNFVVGVPNFLHTDYLAPVAVGQVIRTIGTAVAPRELQTQIMNRAAVANDIRASQFEVLEKAVPAGRDLGDTMAGLPRWEGTAATDFTVFTRKDLTVRRGEKAIITLFTKKIRYGHVYRWSPPQELQHFLVLHNDTDTPWTTGPCLAVSDTNPLSEDLLKYVPKGGKGELLVTTAINIARNQKESEVDRKLKAHEPSHNFFVDLVTLDHEILVHNFGKAEADLVVELRLTGRPVTASEEGSIVLDTANLKLLERTGTVTWRFTLKPGDKKSLSCRYERYVPSA